MPRASLHRDRNRGKIVRVLVAARPNHIAHSPQPDLRRFRGGRRQHIAFQHPRPEAVGTQQQTVAVARPSPVILGLHLRPLADRAGKQVAARVAAHLLRRELPAGDHHLRDAVIRALIQNAFVPEPVDARIADVRNMHIRPIGS